jgi:hypothetical protein
MMEPNTIWTDLWASVAPTVVIAITGLIGVLTTIITVRLNRWFGITNEIQMRANEQIIRNVLHEAVWSAVKFAAQKTGLTAEQLAALTGSPQGAPSKEFIDVAIDYVRSKNPDTAEAAGLAPGAKGDAGLTEIIVSKVPDLLKILVEAAVPGGAIISDVVKAVRKGK